MMVNSEPVKNDLVVDTAPGGVSDTRRPALLDWLLPVLLLLACLIGYSISLITPPLLDEQALVRSIAQPASGAELLGWTGFDSFDAYGPFLALSMKATTFSATNVVLHRIISMLLHAGTACLAMLFLYRLSGLRWLAFGAAMLFALYPLNAEAVNWLGGRGSELAGLLMIGSLVLFQNARGYVLEKTNSAGSEMNWRWLVGSVVLFALALSTSASMWVGAVLILAYETYNWLWRESPSGRRTDPTFVMIGVLSFFVVAAAYIAGTGVYNQLLINMPEFSAKNTGLLLRNVAFPIKQTIWAKYSSQYVVLYVLYVPFLIASIVAFVRNAAYRKLIARAAGWFILAALPAVGYAVTQSSLYGSRWLYAAAVPFCFLEALLLSSPYFALAGLAQRTIWRRTAFGISALGVTVLSIFFLAHLWNQNSALRAAGRMSTAIQKSAKVIIDKNHFPFLMVREIPACVAVSNLVAGKTMFVMDAGTLLPAAPFVSDGLLKDALRDGNYRQATVRWVDDYQSLVPIDITPEKNAFADLDATQIAAKFVPSILHYPQIKLDAEQNLLTLESNSMQGPVMRLSADGLSPIDGDFLWIEAKIDAPPDVKPTMELYWQTHIHNDYDEKERMNITPVIMNDGKYHRYYIPLRSVAWTTVGNPYLITVGFPAGSKTNVKAMGVLTDSSTLRPQLTIPATAPGQSANAGAWRNFPAAADLGFHIASRNSGNLILAYDAAKVDGAAAALLEVSQPNKRFPNPNGGAVSSVTLTTRNLQGLTAQFELPLSDLSNGVYSLRVIGLDKTGAPIGNFSDARICLVIP
jgi:hypothetical protein